MFHDCMDRKGIKLAAHTSTYVRDIERVAGEPHNAKGSERGEDGR